MMKKLTKVCALVLSVMLSACAFSGCFLPFLLFEEEAGIETELTLVGEPSMTFVYDEEYREYDVYIEGFAKNASEQEANGSVSFILYDADGNTLGTAYDHVSAIEAGKTWHFRATSSVNFEPSSFKLKELSGYSYDW